MCCIELTSSKSDSFCTPSLNPLYVEGTLNEPCVLAPDPGRDLLGLQVLLSSQLIVGWNSIENLRQSSICFDSSYLHFPKVGF